SNARTQSTRGDTAVSNDILNVVRTKKRVPSEACSRFEDITDKDLSHVCSNNAVHSDNAIHTNPYSDNSVFSIVTISGRNSSNQNAISENETMTDGLPLYENILNCETENPVR